jgi:hypothetical protein
VELLLAETRHCLAALLAIPDEAEQPRWLEEWAIRARRVIERLKELAAGTGPGNDTDQIGSGCTQAADPGPSPAGAGQAGEAGAVRTGDQGVTGQAGGAETTKTLSRLQHDILDALRTLKATNVDKLAPGPVIAEKVGGGATDQSVKAPLADLKHEGLVMSRRGRKGGSWLTSQGLHYINSLRPKH